MSDHHHHHHGHHHGHHHHGTGPSATGENQDYFNKLAAEYDARHEKTLNKLIEEIRARVDFIGVDWADEEDDDDNNGGDGAEKKDAAAERSVRLLDYACGTGVVSRALAPYTTQCVGVDLSENMVTIYNTRAENQGLAPSEMHAYQGNLCVPDDPNPAALTAPEFSDFDIAAVGLGFHHFDDPSLAARRLAERLKTGGVLMILDFLPHDNMDDSHPAKATVTHHGFSHEHIKRLYEEAGVGKDFGIEEMAVVFHFSKEQDTAVQRKIFIARGTKA